MPTSPSFISRLKVQGTHIAAVGARYLSSGIGRTIIILIAGIITGYIIYQSIWLPLRQAAVLPAGVSPNNPELSRTILQDINAARTERQQSVRLNFSRYNLLFVPPP